MPSPSRSHWMAAPAMNTLPSRAYVVRSPMRQAIVVTSPFDEATGAAPGLSSMKHPVPYVFFAAPGVRHACPNSAACWSPATPAIGTPRGSQPRSVVSPSSPAGGLAAGGARGVDSHAGYRSAAREPAEIDCFAQHSGRRAHRRQHPARHLQDLEHLVIPVAGTQIETERPRRVGRVGRGSAD